MRLFIGLDVPYEMRRNLELLLQLLKPKADIHWSPLTNLHITTKFVGEWPDERLEEMKAALHDVPRPGELPIAFRGLGWFPNPHKPRVFFAGIKTPPELVTLAKETDALCIRLGAAPELKPYQPHMTLARIRKDENLVGLQQAIAALPNTDFGSFTAREFHLYQSQAGPQGSIYTKLASYPLNA